MKNKLSLESICLQYIEYIADRQFYSVINTVYRQFRFQRYFISCWRLDELKPCRAYSNLGVVLAKRVLEVRILCVCA